MANILILYDSKSGNTEKMAKAVAKGAKSVKGAKLTLRKVLDVFLLEELLGADAIILGSPTHYGGLTIPMEWVLDKLKKHDLKGKMAAAFGSFGYKGETVDIYHEKAVGVLNDHLRSLGMTLVDDGLRMFRRPTKKDLKVCEDWGRKVAEKIVAQKP